MHGFLSRDGMPPADLLAAGRAEVESYGGQIISAAATDVSAVPSGGFRVILDDEQSLSARRLLVATGLHDELPNVPGVDARFGRDVLHCPYCHGHEVRSEHVGVLGGSPNSLHQVQLVRQWAPDTLFFTHTGALSDVDREALEARAIGIVDDLVTEIVVDDDRVCGVRLSDGSVVRRTAVFVAPQFHANDGLLTSLGCSFAADGAVLVDRTGQTSVSGVWVAGNVANSRAQVITAAGEGSAAAIAINADLVNDDVAQAVDAFRKARLDAAATHHQTLRPKDQ
jgi:thioredoxin reductase